MGDYPVLPPLRPQEEGGKTGRMFLAVFLCMGVMLAFNALLPPPGPPIPSGPAPQGVSTPPSPVPPPAQPAQPVEPAGPAETVALAGPTLRAVATAEGAGIAELTCLRRPEAAVNFDSPVYAAAPHVAASVVPALLATSAEGLPWRTRWRVAGRGPDWVRFETALPGGVTLAKTVRLPQEGYVVTAEFEAVNGGGAPAAFALDVYVPAPNEAAIASRLAADGGPVALVPRPGGAPLLKTEGGAKIVDRGPWPPDQAPASWGGMSGAYFTAMTSVEGGAFASFRAEPWWRDPAAAQDKKKRNPITDRVVMALRTGAWTLAPGESRTVRLRCYAGPKQVDALAGTDPALEAVLQRGPIATPLFALLRLLHAFTRNYGGAIILLTLLVRGVIHPLNRMAQVSMMTTSEKMKRLQPRIEELKKRHKSNAKRLMEEQSKLMREEGMNPLAAMGGCLPVLLQMPVFIALYNVLQSAMELRGAPFCLWIRDLAHSDSVVDGLPLIGSLNPLPIVLIVVTWVQMWRAPKPPDPKMAEQQRMMLWIMPAMFGFMLYSMPAGLTLYWLTSTSFSILEQWWIRRLLKRRGVIKA